MTPSKTANLKDHISYGEFSNLSMHLNCCDIWRLKYPQQIQFTWTNKDLSKRSRIDFWLISNELSDNVEETKIQPSIFSDHNMITLVICIRGQSIKYKPNYWKLNNILLSDKSFIEKAKTFLTTKI